MAMNRGDMPEMEQWAVAARMLEAHGDAVGSALLARVQSLAGDHQEVGNWLAITEKVQTLHSPDGDA
jgi:hypothetical protein